MILKTYPHYLEVFCLSAGEMAAFLEDRDLIPSIHLASHKCLQLQFQGIRCPPLASPGNTHTSGAQTFIQAKHKFNIHKFTLKCILSTHHSSI